MIDVKGKANNNMSEAQETSVSFFDIIESEKRLEESVSLNVEQDFQANPKNFDFIVNTTKYPDDINKFEYNTSLNKSIIPKELKIVKNSKRENSLCLLKASEKENTNNELHHIRMMRNSIWKQIDEENYELVNVCPQPYKTVMPPYMGMVQFMTDLGVYDEISYYQEHCDGPLFRVYYTNEEWVVSTSSLIYADGHWLNTKTFIDLFKETLEVIGGDLEKDLDKNLSYYFVLQNPEYLQVIPIEKHVIYFKEARNQEFELVHPDSVAIPEHYKRLNVFEDWIVENDTRFLNPSGLYGVVLKNGDTIKVSNWIYEELNQLKGKESHINNMIIHILRQSHHRIELFAYNFPRYLEQLNRTNYLLMFYCDLLFKKFMKQNVFELKQEYPLQKNLYYHVKKMHELRKKCKNERIHLLDAIHNDGAKKQGRVDYMWKENYVRDYVLSCSNQDINILLNMMKTFLKDQEELHKDGTITINEENAKFWRV